MTTVGHPTERCAQSNKAAATPNAVLRLPDTGIKKWRNALAGLRAAIGFWIPVGYQDETGFHFGMHPEQHEGDGPLVAGDTNEF